MQYVYRPDFEQQAQVYEDMGHGEQRTPGGVIPLEP